MKLIKINLPLLLLLFLAWIGMTSCSKVSYMSVRVMEPAKIAIPSHIKSVAIVDRAIPPQTGEKMIAGVFVGEDINRNQSESQLALSGLINTLKQSTRLEPKMTNLKLKGAQLGGTLPTALSADSIMKICKEYQVDGVIAMESFSYSTIVNTAEKAARLVESGIKNGLINTIGKTVGTATTINNEPASTIIVKLGFRFYDGTKHSTCDQLTFTHTFNWQVNNLHFKHYANETSFYAGKLYAKRVAPSYIWVNRSYFRKPKTRLMKMAKRMAIIGDWKGASEMWQEVEKGSSRKKAGRAAYNLALCQEVFGNLDQAKVWCTKSKNVYKNKLAREYLNILDNRILEMSRVEEQMK